MKIKHLAIVLLAALSIVSCTKNNPLDGTWNVVSVGELAAQNAEIQPSLTFYTLINNGKVTFTPEAEDRNNEYDEMSDAEIANELHDYFLVLAEENNMQVNKDKLTVGQLFGDLGCNTYGSCFMVSGDNMLIGDGYTTFMLCADMDVETALKTAYPQVRKYKLNGNTLHLLDADNQTLVTLSKIE